MPTKTTPLATVGEAVIAGITLIDGGLELPHEPGLGFGFDEAVINQLDSDRWA